MAYTDLEFYKNKYFGDAISDADFPKWVDRASDWLDVVTFNRLVDGLLTDERADMKVQKCVCRLADTLYEIEQAQKQATATLTGQSVGGSTGQVEKTIKSVSSGSESVTYMTPSEQASGAKEWSMTYAAASSKAETNVLLTQIALESLTGVTTDEGVPLLYAGL